MWKNYFIPSVFLRNWFYREVDFNIIVDVESEGTDGL